VTAAANHSVPTGAGFDILLLLHVAAVVVGLIAVASSGVMALRLQGAQGGDLPPSVAAYFAPGTNWPGRAVHAVPVLGLLLVWASHGAYGFGQSWVQWGLGLWVVAAGLCEGLLFPSERRVQGALAEAGEGGAQLAAGRTVTWSAAAVLAVLVAASVVMVVKP
jgi:hypothetical protein